MKVYGTEGEIEGQFCRPQGITTDPEGHILICDSRNNRIQVRPRLGPHLPGSGLLWRGDALYRLVRRQ